MTKDATMASNDRKGAWQPWLYGGGSGEREREELDIGVIKVEGGPVRLIVRFN